MVSDDQATRLLAPTTIRYCPLCGAGLAREPVPPDHREQAVCSRCRFIFYLNHKVVAATIKAIAKRPAAFPRVLATSSDKGTGLPMLRAEIASACGLFEA